MTDERPVRAITSERTPAAAVKAVAGFIEYADAIDELLQLIASDPTVQYKTQRLVFALQGNQIAQVGFEITKWCERMMRYTDGSPTDIHGGFHLRDHRVNAVIELSELLEVLGRFCGLVVTTEIVEPEEPDPGGPVPDYPITSAPLVRG